jgi:hypothetical protein
MVSTQHTTPGLSLSENPVWQDVIASDARGSEALCRGARRMVVAKA